MHIPLIFTFVLYGVVCVGQQQFTGKWTNAYNSLLTISLQKEGQLEGTYSSTTGSSGTYTVRGTYAPIDSTTTDLSVALTILWNSTDGTTKDPSQFWTGIMSGSYYGEPGTTPTMELINAISAAEKFDAVGVIEPGIYPESLTFTKQQENTVEKANDIDIIVQRQKVIVSKAVPRNTTLLLQPNLLISRLLLGSLLSKRPSLAGMGIPVSSSSVVGVNHLQGTSWVNREESSPYKSIKITTTGKNTLDASLVINDKAVAGSGLFAQATNNLQSLSVAFFPLSENKETLGITGLLNISNGSLKLIFSQSSNVSHATKYVSTNVNVFYFDKAGVVNEE